jgi:hypothetical protein
MVDTLQRGIDRRIRPAGCRRSDGVHILVNCAARVGGTIPDNMDVISDEQIIKDFEEKFLGYYAAARRGRAPMKQAGWGRIIT